MALGDTEKLCRLVDAFALVTFTGGRIRMRQRDQTLVAAAQRRHGHGAYRGRVHAAAQLCGDHGRRGAQAVADTTPQQGGQVILVVADCCVTNVPARVDVPEFLHSDTRGVGPQPVARGQHAQIGEHRTVRVGPASGPTRDGDAIEHRHDPGFANQAHDARRDAEAFRDLGEVQGAHLHRVTGGEQRARLAVPDDEREVADQSLRTVAAPA